MKHFTTFALEMPEAGVANATPATPVTTDLTQVTFVCTLNATGAHYSIDTFANCRKVEHDKL